MVRELFSGYSQPGPAQVIWDGSNQNNSTVVSGIYFVRLQGDQISSKIKLHLLK